MKINYLKINGFGKLKNKEIVLNENINLVYGKNETGKTTLLKFITAMFYGLSKNKNGKEITDFDRYNPWQAEEFSGKVEYTLDNNKKYEVFRDFSKKNPQILDENREDISKDFNIDKTKGNDFFYEQTKIEENLLFTTSIIEQQNVVLDEKEQKMLTQKIANLLSTGDDNVSYKKTIDKLNKKLIEEVGSDRTTGRPINVINEKLRNINREIEQLEAYKSRKENIEINKKNLNSKIEEGLINIEIIKDIKRIKEEIVLEEEKIKTKHSIKEEYNEKINKLNNKLNTIDEKEISNNNKKINILLIPILIILTIVFIFLDIVKVIKYAMIVLTIGYTIVNLILIMKTKKELKNRKNNSKEESLGIKKEISILEENRDKIEKEIMNNENILKEQLQENKTKIREKYIHKVIDTQIDELFNASIREIDEILNSKTNTYNNLKVEINTIGIEEKAIIDKLELKAKYVGELDDLYEQKEELLKLEEAICLAKNTLEMAYNKMKEKITPKFTQELSTIIEKISDGKYRNINFSDAEGLKVEKDNGEYISANMLSLGTIDQLYLSLRLSAINEISQENMPIILDESFVYYDNDRLINILRYLSENYNNSQIIILTCSNREEKAMKELGIRYNLVEL